MPYYLTCCHYTVILLLFLYVNQFVQCIVLKGQVVGLNSIDYYVPPNPIASLDYTPVGRLAARLTDALYPVTVLEVSNTDGSIDKIVEEFESSDDVFSVGFLEVIVIQTCSAPRISGRSNVYSRYGTKAVIGYCAKSGDQVLGPGPYFWSPSSRAVFLAYRLYSDVQGAFSHGLIPAENGTYHAIPAAVPGAASVTIGVPSRLYWRRDDSKPLAGVRIGVKDIIDIDGVKTSCGNRAYYELYNSAGQTAPVIQKLLDAGAVLVGKMKTSQFANGEWATADWVDYHAPFNPRGDGYQDPGSSSSGPAAGVASYDWLDITLGTDTGGSIRGPAGSNGVYGNRPSHGLTSLEGIMPLSPEMDTVGDVGILARDTRLWREAAGVLYDGLRSNFSLPQRIYSVDFPTNISNPADRVLINFAQSLAEALNSTIEPFDVKQKWKSVGPSAQSNDLADLVSNIFPVLTIKEQFQLLGQDFYHTYEANNNKRTPFVDPSPLSRWNWGIRQPTSAVNQAMKNLTIFAGWWNTHGQFYDTTTCSSSIIIYPGSKGEVSYRNGPYPIDAPGVPNGFGIDRIPSFVGSPDFAVPIGEVLYNSTVTNHMEVLPVVVDIMVAKACDGVLFALIERLAGMGVIPRTVQTGRSIYGTDKINRSYG